MSRGVDSWSRGVDLWSRGVESKKWLAQFWLWSRGVDFGGVVDSWSPELCNREIFGKESLRSELSNAIFEKFLSFFKRKLKHFQTVRFLMNFIQNCDILAVH